MNHFQQNGRLPDKQAISQYVAQRSEEIFNISTELNILTRLTWPSSVKENFFRNGAEKIPEVEYAQYDPDKALYKIEQIRSSLLGSEFDSWMLNQLEIIENSVRMISSVGKSDFLVYSKKLYGKPKQKLKDEKSTPYALARELLHITDDMHSVDLGKPAEACILASTVADAMKKAVLKFGSLAPEVMIVDNLSANALAGADRVRIRRNACFTDKDIDQLVEHEINIHVATILNGKHPQNAKLLGAVHPGSTATQEGLAVFAELITGNMDIDRFRRLAHRVIAIQMAIDGADFIEVYRYFLDETGNPDQSFESTRRVFRGGVLTGGAPFTKDIVYLDGLLRVHNFLRAAVRFGRADVIRTLFVGRLNIEDLPVIYRLKEYGLCAEPRFLPDWIKDMRFLLSYLSYSLFLNSINMSKVYKHYEKILLDL